MSNLGHNKELFEGIEDRAVKDTPLRHRSAAVLRVCLTERSWAR